MMSTSLSEVSESQTSLGNFTTNLFFVSFTSANPKDFIEVKFDLESLDKPIALKSYMNTLVNSNDDL